MKKNEFKETESLSPLHKDSKPLVADYGKSGDGVIIIWGNDIKRLIEEAEREILCE